VAFCFFVSGNHHHNYKLEQYAFFGHVQENIIDFEAACYMLMSHSVASYDIIISYHHFRQIWF